VGGFVSWDPDEEVVDPLEYLPPWRGYVAGELVEYGPSVHTFAEQTREFQASTAGGGLWDPDEEHRAMTRSESATGSPSRDGQAVRFAEGSSSPIGASLDDSSSDRKCATSRPVEQLGPRERADAAAVHAFVAARGQDIPRRELEIYALTFDGSRRTARQVAARLGTSEATTKAALASLRRRCESWSSSQAARCK
jgi:DNA-binding CsgD family transcriptional regulator